MPELTTPEWVRILDAHRGVITDDLRPYRLASDLMDDYGTIDLADLQPEQAALVRKLHDMTQAQQWAILDVVKRFWAGRWENYSGHDEIIAELTGKKTN